MYFSSYYINGRYFKDSNGDVHRSAKVVFCINHKKWIKYIYTDIEESAEEFCKKALQAADEYLQETYISGKNFIYMSELSSDWTEVKSIDEVKWTHQPDIRRKRFHVRDLVFNEEVVVYTSKIKLETDTEQYGEDS